MNDHELDRIISASERRVREGAVHRRLSALQLRIRAARLECSSVENFSDLDSEIHRAVVEARQRLEWAEDLAAARLGKEAA